MRTRNRTDCQVCCHKDRILIDRKIVDGVALALIAKGYQFTYSSLHNHAKNHISRQMATAATKQQLIENNFLLQRIDNIIRKAEKIFERNYKKKNDTIALKALSEQRQVIDMLARISFNLVQLQRAKDDSENEKEEQELLRLEEQREQEFRDSLKILNDEELRVFYELIEKVNNQDKSVIVLPTVKHKY